MKTKGMLTVLIFFSIQILPYAQSDDWTPPAFSERQDERDEMVEQQLIPRDITDDQVVEAMRSVPRHLLVEQNRRLAYADNPLPIGHGQTISQPYIVAYMTQILELQPGDKVLEIGTGSGYQAAVLSHITPHVYSIEIIEELGNRAWEDLEELGYIPPIEIKTGDGYYGWEEHAPFDAIIVTAAAGHIPSPLVQQLKPGGIIVIPIGGPYQTQTLMKVMKSESGDITSESLVPVRFVPMTGEAEN